MTFKRCFMFILLLSLLTGCASQTATPTPATTAVQASPAPMGTATMAPTAPPQPTLAPSSTPAATTTPVILQTATPSAIGPDSYPAGVNPLTGLPVADPASLNIPPALISVSNFPVTTRPQAGLSKAAIVYDAYYGDGLTRYLAVMYGDLGNVGSKPLTVGPMRSGRLPWEMLRSMLNGFLLITNSDPTVAAELNNYTFVYSGINDVNSVFSDTTKIQTTANTYLAKLGAPNLKGMAFSATPPDGGKTATTLWVPFAFLNQVIWRYDSTNNVYNRYADNYDGVTFVKLTDRLNNQPIQADNVVVIFADHTLLKAEKINISLANVGRAPALLLRDGKMYEIFWSTSYVNGKPAPMRFIDAQGNTVPLKPGQTWVEVATTGSPYYETVDSKDYGTRLNQKTPGSGNWVVRFLMP
jgi:hypothetical protein